jgi:antitoxin FitA
MTTLTINLPDARAQELEESAPRLGLTVEQLIEAGIAVVLEQAEVDFRAALDRVLAKNAELYRRLA